MNEIFFTADLHFDHAKIVKLSYRPFDNIKQMNEMLIHNWNSIVSKGDIVWIVGDFAFAKTGDQITKWLRRLNGQKFLIKGNHDYSKILKKSKGFADIRYYKRLRIQKETIILSHYPFETWDNQFHGSWHIHGHCHNGIPDKKGLLRTDVGVDAKGFYPVPFETLKTLMNKEYDIFDYHLKENWE